MKFELGAYSFGAAGKNPEGETITTAQAVRNLLEQIRLAAVPPPTPSPCSATT